MTDFGRPVQEILQNNYLKADSENSEIRDFVPTIWNFIRGEFSWKKYPVFRTLNAHISRTVNATALNEAILKSSH